MSSNIRVKRVCLECGEVFIAKTTVTKFCSSKCSKRGYKSRKRLEKIEANNKAVKAIIEKPILEVQSKEFLTIADVCKILNVSRASIWRLTKSGKLNHAKIGRRVIIQKADIKALFN